MLGVFQKVVGESESRALEKSTLNVILGECSTNPISRSIGLSLSNSIVAISSGHKDEVTDQGDKGVDHQTVGPSHHVDLGGETESGQKLSDGDDSPDGHTRVLVDVLSNRKVVGVKNVTVSVVVGSVMVTEVVKSGVGGVADSNSEESELALHGVAMHLLVSVISTIHLLRGSGGIHGTFSGVAAIDGLNSIGFILTEGIVRDEGAEGGLVGHSFFFVFRL